MSSWCTFRKGTRSDEPSVADFFPTEVAKKRVIQSRGWNPVENALSVDIETVVTCLDDAINAQMYDLYYDAGYHLCLQDETFPLFPLVVIESIIHNRKMWIDGIMRVVDNLTAKKTTLVYPTIGQSWKDIVDEIKESDRDSLVVLILDEQQIKEEDYIAKLFHLLKFFKRRVSVMVNVLYAQIFGDVCSFRTLRQFESLVVRPLASDKLLDVIISSITVDSKYVLQFSPYVLNLMRQKFLAIDGSIETAKNIVRWSMMNHTLENVHWCYESADEFNHLVGCYWKICKQICPQMNLAVVEMHLAIQGYSQVDFVPEQSVRCQIRQWIYSIAPTELITLSSFLLQLCESNNGLAMQNPAISKTYLQLRRYFLRYQSRDKYSVVEDTTISSLSKYLLVLLDSFLCYFGYLPNGKDFVIISTTVENQFACPQMMMEHSLNNQANDVSKCYEALRESGRWKRISIGEWSNIFFKKIGGSDSPASRFAFFASAAMLENSGIVGISSTTPKGFIDIYYHSRI